MMHRACWFLTVAVFAYGSLCGTAQAQILPDRIEEDWQLIVATPDSKANGPQVTTSMSPTQDLISSAFVAFDLNYREYPSYTVGGMQVQVWSNKHLLTSSSQGTAQFNTTNETITWTQFLSISGNTMTYGINNGLSTTFGKFGQGNGLLNVTFPTTLTSLSGYSPTVSVAHSGATWESNHVSTLAILQVRYYANNQLILTDTTRRECLLPP
jgi:hypothetical protein